ncbi:hypothetical protein JUJ52_03120 [Virgibacillus sp. AGTR]|uniref:hypothetical protein n=1 Tax=Virgibacillus sp. AGTR TaxID=2812055 RepID=UPI001D163636|nr:hypothetical protein [Virgibacillus sp. AGTR]MCC2248949.1 hypothetical protein [Virgibacillus sp. AGTR]
MQVRKHNEIGDLIFAQIINTGMYKSARYDVVYNKKTKILHIYDDCLHNDTSITNNTIVKHDILEALGHSDGFVQTFLNRIGKKADNARIRMFIYIYHIIWEVTQDNDFLWVEDESLLYKPFAEKIYEYAKKEGQNF